MSEKGILSKSIANNISEAIIDKLGGTGYAPTEWSRNINLLGISSADIEEALASITEDTSSADKGLLSLSIASDVGAMLNKKYNTSRGFKPCEVSSAVSALTVLPEKTASSAPIATFSDGADDVPLKSCEVALSPSLDGYSSVDVVQTGKNFIDFPDNLTPSTSGGITFSKASNGGITYSGTATGTFAYITPKFDFKIPSGKQFTLSRDTALNFRHYIQLTFSDDTTASVVIDVNNTSITYTPAKDVIAVRLIMSQLTAQTEYSGTVYIQIEFNSSTTVFEAYNGTTHTANLGRTIYGGTPDVVKGEGSTKVYKHTFTGDNLTSVSLNYGTTEDGYTHMYFYTGGIQSAYNPSSSNVISDIGVPWNNNASSSPHPSGECYRLLNTGSGESQRPTIYAYIHQTWESVEDFKTWLNANPITVVYEVADETNFTFEPVEISSRLGNNTMWSDGGDTEVTYRADLDLYEAPSMLLGSNNTETEGNEEQEVNE